MIILSIFLLTLIYAQIQQNCTPFGLRLTYGQYFTQQGGSTQLYVTFNTYAFCPNSYVSFGNLNVYNNFSCAIANLSFTWVNPPYFNNTIYSCPITNIDFSQIILYTAVGVDNNNNSYAYMNKNVTTILYDKDTPQPLTFIVAGDWNYYSPLNISNPPSITNCLNLLKDYQSYNIQGFIFLGDQAYDLSSNNGSNYVQFLIMLQPYSSIWPFIATIGNHDITGDNLNVYLLSYPFPYQYPDLQYYTLVIGDTTFISFNPNAILYNFTNSSSVMQSLLTELTQSISSANTSFVIPFSHYPFFCSQNITPQCSTNNVSLYPIQNLFNQLNIKLYLSAHIHNYQRQYPINQHGVVTDNNLNVQISPNAPIYILEGAAGNTYQMPNSTGPLQYYTASALLDTGFGILQIISKNSFRYNHINGTTCQTVDQVQGLYVDIIINPKTNFPIWAIILLCIIGAGLISFIIWYFCIYKKKQKIKNQKNNQRLARKSQVQISSNYAKI